MLRRRTRFAIVVLLIAISSGVGLYAYKLFRDAQIKEQMDIFARWIFMDLEKNNEVRFKEDHGQKPDWIHLGGLHDFAAFETAAGKKFTVYVQLEATLWRVRITRVQLLYNRHPLDLDSLSTEELGRLAFRKDREKPTEMDISPDAVYSHTAIDLKSLIPDAFESSIPSKN